MEANQPKSIAVDDLSSNEDEAALLAGLESELESSTLLNSWGYKLNDGNKLKKGIDSPNVPSQPLYYAMDEYEQHDNYYYSEGPSPSVHSGSQTLLRSKCGVSNNTVRLPKVPEKRSVSANATMLAQAAKPVQLTEEEQRNADDEYITSKILSLPDIVCRSSSGDVFMVSLSDMKDMLQKRRFGDDGMKYLDLITRSKSSWEWEDRHAHAGAGRHVKKASKQEKKAKSFQVNGRTDNSGSGVGTTTGHSAAQANLDAEVRRHLDATTARIEELRERLATGVIEKKAAKAEVLAREAAEEAERLRRAEEQTSKLATRLQSFGHHKYGNRGRGGPPKISQKLAEKLHNALSNQKGEESAGETSPTAKGSGQGRALWGRMKSWMDQLTERWDETDLRKPHEKASGWDSVFKLNDVYVKGAAGFQGASVYISQCQQLGVIPSTQVIQQLGQPEANMAHCKLGRRGTIALRHALTANQTMQSLNLSDNGIDSVAAAELINGLVHATLCAKPEFKKALATRWQKLEFLRQPPLDFQVSVVPSALTQQKQELDPTASSPPQSPPRERASASEYAQTPLPSVTQLTISPVSTPSGPPGLATGNNSQAGAGGTGSPRPSMGASQSHVHSLQSQITHLDISQNPLGVHGAKMFAQLIDPLNYHSQFLTSLILNKCGIPDLGGIAILNALCNSNLKMGRLHLSNNELGDKTAAVAGDLLSCNRVLTDLDLSWNRIQSEGAAAIALGLQQNAALMKLNLAWNGLESPGVSRLGEMMKVNVGLRHLDLTNTRMGSAACIHLADGLKNNNTLEVLILNGNAIGDSGARMLMGAIKGNNSLQYLGLQGTNMTSAAADKNHVEFNPLAPDGYYSLELVDAADRTIATQLCEMDAAAPNDLMMHIKLNGRNIPNCKSQGWPGTLPVNGTLTFDFVTRRNKKTLHVLDDKKFGAFQAQMHTTNMSDRERLSLVEVMAPFNYVNGSQASRMLKSFSMGDEQIQAAIILFLRAFNLDDDLPILKAALGERESLELMQHLSWYGYYRFYNMTGHYELSMTVPLHRHLTMRLKDVAWSEEESNNWINVVYDKYTSTLKISGNYGPPEVWKGVVPTSGDIAVDYVSSVPPPEEHEAMTDEEFERFLREVGIMPSYEKYEYMPEADFDKANIQMGTMRRNIGRRGVTCAQLRRGIDAFMHSPHRIEICILLWPLTVDRQRNWFSVMWGLGPIEQGMVTWRLGPSNIFDRNHPTGHYILDIGNESHEQLVKRLIDMANSGDEGLPKFWNMRLQGERLNIIENRNMYGSLTSASFNPFFEFDYIGPDSWEMLGKSKLEVEAMGAGDKLELRTRLALRNEVSRIKAMYGYYDDGSGWIGPNWSTATQIWQPLMTKAPWLASYDRVMRLLVRMEIKSGDIQADSFVEDYFDEYMEVEAEIITQSQLETLMKDCGYNRQEVAFYTKLFEAKAEPVEPDGPPGLNFFDFVDIFMMEPPKALRNSVAKNAFSISSPVEHARKTKKGKEASKKEATLSLKAAPSM